ncbi:hypothetical protein F8G81_16700 [Arthrobacter sp. CDRTa11]|uniref:hypothetical protein n=1 Tax=Arthrobacter sp. CDRTa11 TaxID=2651199 RepID=UPI002265F170|nr:hypothetical protein [Arthrobacter sp. CDRTa11]UZX04059.1 hypothetical protein F8G81_16700 [Arthrobacter sp. CDRTa11]
MTDPTGHEATPDTGSAIPDAAYRMTSHEILALLAFDPGAGTSLTRRVLGLAELPDDHDLVRAGVGTLNIRDTAKINGEEVTLLAEARILARIFSTSSEWFDVTRIGAEAVSPSYLVDSPAGRAAIFLRPLSEYLCLPLRDDVNLLDFVQMTVDESVAALSAEGGGIVTSRRYRAGSDKPLIANIKVLDAGALQLASAPLDEDGQLGVRDLAADEKPGATVRTLLSAAA